MFVIPQKMNSFLQKFLNVIKKKITWSFHLGKYPRHFSKSEPNVSEFTCPWYPSANDILPFTKDVFQVLLTCNYNLYYSD